MGKDSSSIRSIRWDAAGFESAVGGLFARLQQVAKLLWRASRMRQDGRCGVCHGVLLPVLAGHNCRAFSNALAVDAVRVAPRKGIFSGLLDVKRK
jgi:hypothetical protein